MSVMNLPGKNRNRNDFFSFVGICPNEYHRYIFTSLMYH